MFFLFSFCLEARKEINIIIQIATFFIDKKVAKKSSPKKGSLA
jgi:hypothetical protein